MREQYPIFILLSPFLFAFAVSLVGLYKPRLCYSLTLISMALSFAAAVGVLARVVDEGVVHYNLSGWPPPIGIEYVIDPLNACVLTMISMVGLIAAYYSKRYVKKETPGKKPHFYTLYLLLLVGLLGMTITGDAFNLYVFLEISSLASYALIAMGPRRAAFSCFNYIIMGTIGASFYLLGVGYLYIKTGSLNMADISRILSEQDLYGSKSVEIGFIFIMIGVWVKMAFFPLHRWLPDAYAYAPSSASAIIAPLMTKVSVYVMIRFMYTVFDFNFVFSSPARANLVIWLSISAIVLGSFYALARIKLRKVLSFLIVAEVGYMVGGAWMANKTALQGAIFHILADGLMTLSLFMFAGILLYKNQNASIKCLGGLYSRMPLTMAAFTVAAFSMIGIPPTAGFFSKFYLISGAIEAGHWEFVVALLFSSLVNAALFFKIIERAHFDKPRGIHAQEDLHGPVKRDEPPLSMLVPLLTSAALILILGIFSDQVMTFISQYVTGTG